MRSGPLGPVRLGPVRLGPERLGPAMLAAVVLTLSACAGPATQPLVAATPATVETPRPKPRRVVHAKRPEPACAAIRIDLPQDRKEALFREFDAMVTAAPVVTTSLAPGPNTGPNTGPGTGSGTGPGPATDCRQASR